MNLIHILGKKLLEQLITDDCNLVAEDWVSLNSLPWQIFGGITHSWIWNPVSETNFRKREQFHVEQQNTEHWGSPI